MFGKSKIRSIVILQIVIIASLSFLALSLFNTHKLFNSENNLIGDLKNCPIKNQIKNTQCLQHYLEPLIIDSGPQEALNFVRSNNIPTSFNLVNEIECHDFAHALGFVAGKNTKDPAPVAIEKCGEDCFSGCYHGFFEGFKFNASYQAEGLDNSCIKNSLDQTKITGCLHALGHYFMERSSNRLFEGFDHCLNINSKVNFQTDCLSGAWMEAEGSLRNPILIKTTPSLPSVQNYLSFCNSLPLVVKNYCIEEGGPYIYRTTRDPKLSTQFCLDRSQNIEKCLSALGGFFHRKNLDKYSQYVLDNCNLKNDDYTFSCISGAVRSLVISGDLPEELISKCLQQGVIKKSICKTLFNISGS